MSRRFGRRIIYVDADLFGAQFVTSPYGSAVDKNLKDVLSLQIPNSCCSATPQIFKEVLLGSFKIAVVWPIARNWRLYNRATRILIQ
jgi:hypothetical protein